MRWLALSSEVVAPVPKIEFSFKKPLFAASVVLDYSRTGAVAEARVRIPFKGDMHYAVEVTSRGSASSHDDRSSDVRSSSRGDGLFAFAKVVERDVISNKGREITSEESSYVVRPVGEGALASAERKVDVVNESPARLLAHLQTLPAFRQTHSRDESLYGGYIAIGAHIEALRIERVDGSAGSNQKSKTVAAHDASAGASKSTREHSSTESRVDTIEVYEIRTMRVPRMLSEQEWSALPWASRGFYGMKYDVEKMTLTAASFTLPIIGKIEIKA